MQNHGDGDTHSSGDAGSSYSPQPVDPETYVSLGWERYGQGDFRGAVDGLQRAFERYPEDVELAYIFGMSLKMAGEKQSAVNAFKRVLDHLQSVNDDIQATMLKRLTSGQINLLEQGDWNLEEEIWKRV
jgi:tetratricopeptide (TPR) repeat protein